LIVYSPSCDEAFLIFVNPQQCEEWGGGGIIWGVKAKGSTTLETATSRIACPPPPNKGYEKEGKDERRKTRKEEIRIETKNEKNEEREDKDK
jgi:hypothetical protein